MDYMRRREIVKHTIKANYNVEEAEFIWEICKTKNTLTEGLKVIRKNVTFEWGVKQQTVTVEFDDHTVDFEIFHTGEVRASRKSLDGKNKDMICSAFNDVDVLLNDFFLSDDWFAEALLKLINQQTTL